MKACTCHTSSGDRRSPKAGICVPLRPLITVSRKRSSLSLVANRLGPRPPVLRWQSIADGSATRRTRASAAALNPRPPSISPSPVPALPLFLEWRQHVLDHLGVVGAALVDLAVDGKHPEHPALRRRVVEAGIAAEA